MRHIVNIHCPPDALGDDGQLRGQAGVVRREVPCSIETLGGSEAEFANQQIGISSYRVELYGDPDRRIHVRDWLTLGPRKLSIEAIDDPTQFQGGTLTLICGERH